MVAIAQRKNLRWFLWSGPSSSYYRLWVPVLTDRVFAFHGYLPIEPGERAKN